MNHENDSNEAKVIIKMRQMDQNEWVKTQLVELMKMKMNENEPKMNQNEPK